MDKIATIAIREFLETVRTKAFFITVVLVPLLVMGFVFGADRIRRLTEAEAVPPRRIALLDETGLLAAEFQKQIAGHNEREPQRPFELTEVPATTDAATLTHQVLAGQLYAYVRIPADAVNGNAACELGRKDQQLRAGATLRQMINAAVHAVRFAQSDMDEQRVLALQRNVEVESIDVRTGQPAKDGEFIALLTPFAAMFLLFMGIMQISYGLLTSVLEEKSSRVIEVLLSAVSPLQLMAGKIIGMVVVGVLLLCVWGAVGYSVAQARGYGQLISYQLLAYAGMYFVPGFLLFSAVLAAIGSACNTLKEAQSMASPVTILNIVPMVLWFPISQSPNSVFSVALSYVPPITPFVMILRVCADRNLPLWQLVSTQVVLWASVLAAIWAAAKIFRVGVLMYGKPPSVGELLRWVRYA